MAGLANADGPEIDTGVPHGVSPRPHDVLNLLGPGVGGQIEVRRQPAQHSVADTAADEEQLAPGQGEPAADLAQNMPVLIQRHRSARQQVGIVCRTGHAR